MLHRCHVPPEAAGQRLDQWLEQALDGCSRSLVARCIRDQRCEMSAGKVKPGYRLRGGEVIDIEVPEIEPLAIHPETIPLAILYEDDDLLVIDKAPGMVVHPAVGHRYGTVLAAVLGRYGSCADDPQAPGLIHRLDADTSGVLAIARHPQALTYFQDQFRQRQVEKRYLALCAGTARSDWWTCREAIGRHPKDFRKRSVVPSERSGARSAHTDFRVRQRSPHYMAVEACLHTGRTHQIRVHLAHAGHPVLADAVYGRHGQWPLQGAPILQRQGLHAWSLGLSLSDGSFRRFFASVPADMAALVDPTVLNEGPVLSDGDQPAVASAKP
ncbi:MAG: RluA family pseudouridine synthase [Planctomycetota bacterium]|nr:MAG: RluA family pseudouridine synthase [Planctomycetota bacterium]